jgi:hypothetical protein
MIYRDLDTDIKFANETPFNFGHRLPTGTCASGLNDAFAIGYWLSVHFKPV